MNQDEKNKLFELGLRELMLRHGIHTLVVNKGWCSGFNEAGAGLLDFKRVVVDGPEGEIERYTL